MSDFHEILFPVDISYGSGGGPKWKTAVWSADSGFEARVIDWDNTRAEYDVSTGVQDAKQMDALTNFFMARRGRAYGFRFKDWNDYYAENIEIGVGDYGTKSYPIIKTYSSPGYDGTPYTFNRWLRKVAWGSENGVTVDDELITRNPGDTTRYSVDYNQGYLKFNHALYGGWYHGNVPYEPIDFITFAEGGQTESYDPGMGNFGHGIAYDPTNGWAYMVSNFFEGESNTGLRKFDIETAEELVQASASDMGLPPTGNPPYTSNSFGTIIAVSHDGYIYGTMGGLANHVPIVKIDGQNMQYVTHWGVVNPFGSSDTNAEPATCGGAVSLDGKLLVHHGFGGGIYLHDTNDCSRIKMLLDTGSLPFPNHIGVTPYRNNGFAIIYNREGDEEGSNVLFIQFGRGVGYEADVFGEPGESVVDFYYDKATGGILVFVENYFGHADDDDSRGAWCGLWHEDVNGFKWKRPMPRHWQTAGLSGGNKSQPLNGLCVWGSTAPYFGSCMWILNTTNGELRARRLSVTLGGDQVYDPERKLFMNVGDGTDCVVSTDVQGVPMDPPEEVKLGYVEFHVGVRFDTDHLNLQPEYWTQKSWSSIPLVEVRNWEDVDLR